VSNIRSQSEIRAIEESSRIGRYVLPHYIDRTNLMECENQAKNLKDFIIAKKLNKIIENGSEIMKYRQQDISEKNLKRQELYHKHLEGTTENQRSNYYKMR